MLLSYSDTANRQHCREKPLPGAVAAWPRHALPA